uniref:Uncharacterized protein n=3 Tax=Anopheles atroparvus TaxID=41427 RepID=A0AAG5DR53_ANOAO
MASSGTNICSWPCFPPRRKTPTSRMYNLKEIEEVFNENIHYIVSGQPVRCCGRILTLDRIFPFSPFSLLQWHDQGSHFGHDKRRQMFPTVAGWLGNIFSFCHVGLKNSGVTPVFAPARFPFGEGIALTRSPSRTSVRTRSRSWTATMGGSGRCYCRGGRRASRSGLR